MRSIVIIVSLLFIVACNNSKTTTTNSTEKLPEKPGSIESTQQALKGKEFKTVNVGTVSPFEMDKDHPYDWWDKTQDSTAKKYLSERMQFALAFKNDTAVTVFDEGKQNNGTWRLDTANVKDEPAGMKLKLSYMDSTFGDTPMMLTYTYLINGISERQLFLQTPREFNSRKIVVMMEVK